MSFTVIHSTAPSYDHTGWSANTGTTCHKTLQKYVAGLEFASLMYVATDCREAADAMPEGPKASHYTDTALYCGMEIRKRQK
jgi:hypothetical protein